MLLASNSSPIASASESESLPEDEFFSFLSKRRGILEGVCVSGGEPTLQADIDKFLARIKDMGFLVKLDTNGYRPDVLSSLIGKGLLDFVAMDIKSSREGYKKAVGLEKIDISLIEKSVDILKSSPLKFEFRTTLVKGIHTESDMISIGEWIGNVERYFLQGFKDSGDLISPLYKAFDNEEMSAYLMLLRKFIPNAQIRG